jgi:hypothetical protein
LIVCRDLCGVVGKVEGNEGIGRWVWFGGILSRVWLPWDVYLPDVGMIS